MLSCFENLEFLLTIVCVSILLDIQIEECALEMFDSIVRADNIRIDMDVETGPQTLIDYIEAWRMKLWDTAYTGVFKGADAYKKSDSFKDFRGSMLAVKRVIYR